FLIRLQAKGHGSHADVSDNDSRTAKAFAIHKARMLEQAARWANANTVSRSVLSMEVGCNPVHIC
ncbi:MAG: hypothetical protein JWR15_3966, partial [Prosthecobacter sp.]|nr:hypothetical protein [Prosthecobacter sp.]